jgi:hypothetical protein
MLVYIVTTLYWNNIELFLDNRIQVPALFVSGENLALWQFWVEKLRVLQVF